MRSSTTPPNTGTDAPHHPAAAAGGRDRQAVAGAQRARRPPPARSTSAAPRPRRVPAPRRRAPSASPAATSRGWRSATACGVVDERADGAPARRARSAGPRRRRAHRDGRSGQLDRWRSVRSSGRSARDRGVGLLGGAPAPRTPPSCAGDLVGRPSPARRPSSSATAGAAASVAGTVEQVGPGAPQRDVVERGGHLAGARRTRPRPAGTAARGPAAGRATGRRRSGPRPLGWRVPKRPARWAAGEPSGGSVWPAAPNRRSFLVRQRALRPSRPSTSSTVSSAISRYVVSLPPAIADDAGRADRHAVAAGQVGRAAARRPT